MMGGKTALYRFSGWRCVARGGAKPL